MATAAPGLRKTLGFKHWDSFSLGVLKKFATNKVLKIHLLLLKEITGFFYFYLYNLLDFLKVLFSWSPARLEEPVGSEM